MSTESESETREQVNQRTLGDIRDRKPVFWENDSHVSFKNLKGQLDVSVLEIKDAEARLKRFAPFIKAVFEDTVALDGLIESPISDIDKFNTAFENSYVFLFPNQMLDRKCTLLTSNIFSISYVVLY